MSNTGHQNHPTAFACKSSLIFGAAITAKDMKARTKLFLSGLTNALEAKGCKLVGHIKGLINADKKGHLMFSITSFAEGARFKGKMEDGIKRAILTVNVIVYGIDQKIVEAAYQEAFNKHFG